MHIERLSFEQSAGYDGLEAAIHIARYAFVKKHCAGKRVLDIACGEGYGSRLMANWGAVAVEGVDISEEAIIHAKASFGGDNINFTQHPAETVDALFEPASFDMVVSLETIEHVEDPVAFLTAIKRLLKPDGLIVVSCPNDWWYFPEANKGNPFHRRKYHFTEFRALTHQVLGEASGWYLGGPIAGFSNLQMDGYVRAQSNSSQILMCEARPIEALAVPAELEAGPQARNASYFIGVWAHQNVDMSSAAVLPLSMDAFKEGIFQGHLQDAEALKRELQEATSEVDRLRGRLAAADEGHVRKLQLRNHALSAENELMKEGLARRGSELAQLQAENVRLSVAAARYVKLRNLMPAFIRMPLLRVARRVRRIVRG